MRQNEQAQARSAATSGAWASRKRTRRLPQWQPPVCSMRRIIAHRQALIGRGKFMGIPSLKLTLATLAGTALHLGLAILGWGGFAAFFAHPARLVLAIVVVVLTIAALF